MAYRLALIDLDDTLLGHDKKVSPENRNSLDRLRAAGIEVVIASGRQHDNIARYAEETGGMDWIVSAQGAVVRRFTSVTPLYELTLPLPLALDVYQQGIDRGLTVIGYHRDGIFAETDNEWTRLYASRAGQQPKLGGLRAQAKSGLQKLFWTASKETITSLVPGMQAFYRDRLYVVQTEAEHLEFIPAAANKAFAAQAIARELDLAPKQIIAFGDGNNDVPMLEWAGMSVAMDHGREAARRAAKKVTPPGPPGTAFARGVDLVLG